MIAEDRRDATVRRQVEGFAKELTLLESEADELAREIGQRQRGRRVRSGIENFSEEKRTGKDRYRSTDVWSSIAPPGSFDCDTLRSG